MATNETKTNESGPRSFSVLLQKLADGDAHTQLSEEVLRVTKEIQARAKESSSAQKGSVTFTLKFAGDDAGMLDMSYDIKTTLPKAKRARTTMWIDKTGNIVDANPRQIELGLRSVGGEKKPVREAGEEKGGAREA